MSIIWLASYPKSGNTWLRAFLTNYWHKNAQPAGINELLGRPIATDRNEFDELVGIESADMRLREIEHYRPLACTLLADEVVPPFFIKVHDAYAYNADGDAFFPAAVTSGVIYLIRNPLDVAVSYAHHEHRPVAEIIARMNCDEAYLFDPAGTPFLQLPQKLLAWGSHVRSWVENRALKLHVVRYEDMVRQPLVTFSGIVRFAGLEFDVANMQQSITFSHFAQLQAQEAVQGFAEKQPTALSFFRQGAVGTWRTALTPEQVQQLVDAQGQVMARFGYLAEAEAFLRDCD